MMAIKYRENTFRKYLEKNGDKLYEEVKKPIRRVLRLSSNPDQRFLRISSRNVRMQ